MLFSSFSNLRLTEKVRLRMNLLKGLLLGCTPRHLIPFPPHFRHPVLLRILPKQRAYIPLSPCCVAETRSDARRKLPTGEYDKAVKGSGL
jgi:hypothetical protein